VLDRFVERSSCPPNAEIRGNGEPDLQFSHHCFFPGHVRQALRQTGLAHLFSGNTLNGRDPETPARLRFTFLNFDYNTPFPSLNLLRPLFFCIFVHIYFANPFLSGVFRALPTPDSQVAYVASQPLPG